MSIFHKILVALIFLTIPFNFFFACRALKTHQIWREKIVKLEKQIAQTEKESHELEYGVMDEKTGRMYSVTPKMLNASWIRLCSSAAAPGLTLPLKLTPRRAKLFWKFSLPARTISL